DKYADSILFPLAVPEHEREELDERTLEHIETLYLEYCWNSHFRLEQEKHDANCEVCKAALRVRENFKMALSAYEAKIESARQDQEEAYYIGLMRRITGRRNPEALFGDLWDEGGAGLLERFKVHGFDPGITEEELLKYAPQTKERGDWKK